MTIWKTNSDNMISLWIGKFRSAQALADYTMGDFAAKLSLPVEYRWARRYFYSSNGQIADAVRGLPFSSSFADQALKKIGKTNANSAIVLIEHQAKDKIPTLKEVTFVGRLSFDEKAPRADEVAAVGLNPNAISVWAGSFKTQRQFEKYFNLPDHVIRNNKFDYLNEFARDFCIKDYPNERASYNNSSTMKSRPLDELVNGFWFDVKVKKRIISDALAQEFDLINTVYVAVGLDYNLLLKVLKDEPASRYDFWFVGSYRLPANTKRSPRKKK